MAKAARASVSFSMSIVRSLRSVAASHDLDNLISIALFSAIGSLISVDALLWGVPPIEF